MGFLGADFQLKRGQVWIFWIKTCKKYTLLYINKKIYIPSFLMRPTNVFLYHLSVLQVTNLYNVKNNKIWPKKKHFIFVSFFPTFIFFQISVSLRIYLVMHWSTSLFPITRYELIIQLLKLCIDPVQSGWIPFLKRDNDWLTDWL